MLKRLLFDRHDPRMNRRLTEPADLRAFPIRKVDPAKHLVEQPHRMIGGDGVTGLPVVHLRNAQGNLEFPCVCLDNRMVARLAADHLLQRGLRHFAFCGNARGVHQMLDKRGDEFRRMIEEAGYECDVFPAEPKRARQASWEKQQERLANWIDGLPKPVGIMAANDERGLMVLDACRRHNRRVPEEVAVIGVDINPDNNRKDVLTVGFDNWAVKEGPMASAEFNGIKVTLRKVGSQGTGLAIGWWKGGLDYGVTMANDGAYVKDGNRGGQRLV